ncbi:MAG: HK97 family phage prohead protease [Clostridia bacterium]|nr:HK97 family phage prohead protease [Clostridia bacterium]
MSRKSRQGMRTQTANLTRKADDGESGRKFTLSFSSEIPYDRWWGTEILDHAEGAIDISRLSEIGCILFNHNPDAVVGRITDVWVEDSRGMAEIEFDTDEDSEKIFQKVANGTLKGVSVGYVVDEWEELGDGKTSEDGRFTGPCDIARRWTPLEVSIVSIPADPTVGVGRSMDLIEQTEPKQGRTLDWYARQLAINTNIIKGGKR